MTVWTHTQGVYPATATPSPRCWACRDAQVRCIHVEGSGCYGHNGADDAAADAALIARAVPGVPVRRAVDARAGERLGAAGAGDGDEVSAALDASGTHRRLGLRRVEQHAFHAARRRRARCCRRGCWPSRSPPPPPKPIPMPEGGGDRNSIPIYTLPYGPGGVSLHSGDAAARVGDARAGRLHERVLDREFHGRTGASPPAPIRWRSACAIWTIRARATVVTRGRRRFRLGQGASRPAGHGYGFAFARYKNLAAYCAVAAEVAVEHETGRTRLVRAVAAVDAGQVVNPDGLAQPGRGRHPAIGELDAVRERDVRCGGRDQPGLVELPDHALRRGAGQRRGARHRPPGPAVPRRRRVRPGPGRGGDRQRAGRRDRRSACATCR